MKLMSKLQLVNFSHRHARRAQPIDRRYLGAARML